MSISTPTLANTLFEAKCYPNDVFVKMVEESKVITLFNAVKGDKMVEVMMGMKRDIYFVEYDKASDGNAFAAKQYCVTVGGEANFNENAVEFLNKALEKVKGQKV